MGIKSYFAAPNYTCHPDGPVSLGSIITDPQNPEYCLATKRVPIPESAIFVVSQENYKEELKEKNTTKASLWLKFLEWMGFEVSGSKEDDVLRVAKFDRLETRTFVPSSDYITTSLKEPEVRRFLLRDDDEEEEALIYMITGVKIAHGVDFTEKTVRKSEGKLSANADGSIADLPLGGKASAERSAGGEQSSHFEIKTTPIVFAYRLQQIRYRKGVQPTHQPYLEGALYGVGNRDDATEDGLHAEKGAETIVFLGLDEDDVTGDDMGLESVELEDGGDVRHGDGVEKRSTIQLSTNNCETSLSLASIDIRLLSYSILSARSFFTASLSSSVLDYPVEHGRRYHAYRKGSYLFPNDDRENERLDVMHHIVLKTIKGLYLAPIDKESVQNILDVGTGTGAFAIELGDSFPGAQVIGCDLSPIQPTWTAPNVKFQIDDVESEWTYPFSFDFIVSRGMAASIGNWNGLASSIYKNLKPGGWVEFQDYDDYRSDDGTLTDDTHFRKWNRALSKGLVSINRDPCPGPKLRSYAEKAGFVNIREEIFKIPLGPWAKDPELKQIGMMNLVQMLDGLEAFSLKMFDMMGYTRAETEVLLANVRKELKGRAFHAYGTLYVVYGQKPEVEK
ncbi:uncharacterized protein DNG_03961 [Cephalotrichum gorgonifer]|uniref:Methyltransferase domain-containing protein n=1 Tax=Cephalotrichum gorgonifer TaxID=2041049 RepID=A0AAE8SUG4_9PEZI|nr:uncharacterized protein DNG_03961 [Cephalotrichum gorgonifer]